MKRQLLRFTASGAVCALAACGVMTTHTAYAADSESAPLVTNSMSEFVSALNENSDTDGSTESETGSEDPESDASNADDESELSDTEMTDEDSTESDDAETLNEAEAQPSAEIPNPLDFSSFAEDPDDYKMPESARRFGTIGNLVIPAPQPGSSATGKVPAGLEAYYSQRIEWGACEPFEQTSNRGMFQCAYIIVPVDYSKPDGQRAAIGLRRYPASGEYKGTIFMDPGGPGFGGMWMASLGIRSHMRELHRNFDIVGFDPRGTGVSLPQIRCQSNAATDAQRQGSDGLSGDKLDKILEYNTNECYKRTGAGFANFDSTEYLANIGTRNVIQDLDVMRSIVGDEKLNYMGFSYGTSIGYQYVQAFRDNARAILLDGVVNPYQNNKAVAAKYDEYFPTKTGSEEVAQMIGFQGTFEQFALRCAKEEGFTYGGQKVPCALGAKNASLTELTQRFYEITRPAYAAATFENTSDGRHVSWADVSIGVIQAMYSDELWPTLNAALAQLADGSGNGTLIQRLADEYWGRDAGEYEFGLSAFQVISCVDDGTDYSDRNTLAAEALEKYQKAPFTDPGKDPQTGKQREAEQKYGWCQYFKKRGDLPTGVEVKNAPNVLVMSTTHDSATPYPNGVIAAMGLKGTLVTVSGARHTSYGSSACGNEIVNKYFMDLTVPTDGTESGPEMETKDLHSRTVNGHECRVNRFDTLERQPSTVNVDTTETTQGATLTFTVTGGEQGETVTFTVNPGNISAGTAIVDAEGRATATWNVPADLASGEYSVAAAFGTTGENATSQTFSVTEKPQRVFSVNPDKDTVKQGEQITFTAAGGDEGETVTFTVHSDPVVAGTAVVEGGVARLTWTVPSDFEVGSHTVTAEFAMSRGVATSSAFSVIAADGTPQVEQVIVPKDKGKAKDKDEQKLARTGSQVVLYSFAVCALLACAGAISAVSRRRQSHI
ncbi:alpha/beta fold hydrolase [Schaalia sp. lx-100]|uniref:alpha/beta fold hydrolase n=1 Tax=Schaalia sp. lx-100 TaxID=2899081 RepID=UPI001E2D1218|nr:alpha/beta fold hydrolase [Schaalia sp. lx-100]MCD4557610.1 alpha/beta fold hydrolase [Schaalia sp. lx-100]